MNQDQYFYVVRCDDGKLLTYHSWQRYKVDDKVVLPPRPYENHERTAVIVREASAPITFFTKPILGPVKAKHWVIYKIDGSDLIYAWGYAPGETEQEAVEALCKEPVTVKDGDRFAIFPASAYGVPEGSGKTFIYRNKPTLEAVAL